MSARRLVYGSVVSGGLRWRPDWYVAVPDGRGGWLVHPIGWGLLAEIVRPLPPAPVTRVETIELPAFLPRRAAA